MHQPVDGRVEYSRYLDYPYQEVVTLFVFLHIAVGMRLEAWGAAQGYGWTEDLIGLASFAHLSFYFVKPPKFGAEQVTRSALFICIALATFGELVLSALWGVYEYRVSVLPYFVPPCHVLLFLAGMQVTHFFRKTRLPWVIPAVTLLCLASQWGQGKDMLSAGLVVLLVPCLIYGPSRHLYLNMFTMALALELGGTYFGIWKWVPVLPGTDLESANPPLAAGVFYALLDLLTLWLTSLPLYLREEFRQTPLSID